MHKEHPEYKKKHTARSIIMGESGKFGLIGVIESFNEIKNQITKSQNVLKISILVSKKEYEEALDKAQELLEIYQDFVLNQEMTFTVEEIRHLRDEMTGGRIQQEKTPLYRIKNFNQMITKHIGNHKKII